MKTLMLRIGNAIDRALKPAPRLAKCPECGGPRLVSLDGVLLEKCGKPCKKENGR